MPLRRAAVCAIGLLGAAVLVACEPAFASGAVEGKVAVAVNQAAGRVNERINVLDLTQLAQGFVIVAVAIYTFISGRHQATQDKVDALEMRLVDKQEVHGERLSRLEQAIASLATHRDLNAISTNVAAISSQMDGLLESQKVMREHLESSLRPLARMQDMLTQHQLDIGMAAKKPPRRRPST